MAAASFREIATSFWMKITVGSLVIVREIYSILFNNPFWYLVVANVYNIAFSAF